jgi:hypothetical protein
MQFTKDGIIRVPYAKDVGGCEDNALHAPMFSSDNSPPTHCSSLLDEQLKGVQEKNREYYELQKAKAQKWAELDQLQQECFGLKK